jgi:hypothetical protein
MKMVTGEATMLKAVTAWSLVKPRWLTVKMAVTRMEYNCNNVVSEEA